MDKIKIFNIFGQYHSEGSGHKFTFPASWDINGDWKKYLKDVRTVLNDQDVTKCYASWCTNEGWWVAKIVKNKEYDTRQGYAIFSICLGNNLPKYGLDAIRTLDSLVTHFINPVEWTADQNEIQKKIDGLSQTIELSNAQLIQSDDTKGTAIRCYNSEAELYDIFSNLAQSYHRKYSRVIYVNNTDANNLTPNSYIDITNVSLASGYEINCAPNDGTVSTTRAMNGDEVTLTFKDLSGNNKSVTFVAGEDTPYATYHDNIITIKRHSILRLIGQSAFTIKCTNEFNTPIKGWTATPRSSAAAIAIEGDQCLFPTNSTSTIQISISLDGYKPEIINIDLAKVSNGAEVTIPLKPYVISAPKEKKNTSKLIAIIGCALLLIIGAIVIILGSGDDKKTTDSDIIVQDNEQIDNSIDSKRQDIEYVYKNDNIQKSILKTDEFVALIEYIASGQIEPMFAQITKCYDSSNASLMNTNLKDIYTKLDALRSNREQSKVDDFAEKCRKLSYYNDNKHGTEINLRKLNQELDNIINPPKEEVEVKPTTPKQPRKKQDFKGSKGKSSTTRAKSSTPSEKTSSSMPKKKGPKAIGA